MKIALECPVALLDIIQPLGDFDWILTHLVLQNPEYAAHYSRSSRFKVLDNSVNELLKPCSWESMLQAAESVNPTLLCPPDFLGDKDQTLSMLKGAVKAVGPKKILPVLQGSNWDEVIECSKEIQEMGFRRIAVPYDILSKRTDPLEEIGNQRGRVVTQIRRDFMWVHLLGLSDPGEMELYGGAKEVGSIDTGAPYLNGGYGRRFGQDELFDKTVRMEYNCPVGNRWEDVFYNIAVLRKLVGGGEW